MERTPVESSLIASVAYDARRMILDIWFTTGRRYRYFEVEPEVVEALMNAPSKGRFFNDEIRDAYIYRRLV